MKTILIILFTLIGTAIAGYFGYLYLLPNVTVINNSNVPITSFVIQLPGSRLDFGGIEPGAHNTIYYKLNQTDGSYQISTTLEGEKVLEKNCGYITNNELHKRVTVTLTQSQTLICASA